jgi:hypothetical protein
MEGGEELPVLILHYLQQRVVEDVPSLHQHFRQQLTPGTLPFIPPIEEKQEGYLYFVLKELGYEIELKYLDNNEQF